MTSTEKYGITKFDEQNYTQIVVDFIFNNSGCTAADILKKEEKRKEKREIGRKRLFAILRKLKRKKVMIEKKKHKNARNIMLYVREDNPIYTVSKELREFENLYPSLLKKVKEELESGKRLQKPEYFQYPEEFREPVIVQSQLIFDSTLLLFEIIRIFMLRSLIIWPRIIQDKYTRERLNFTIFSKLYQMQIKMSETLGYPSIGGQNAFIASVSTELSEIKERIEIVSGRLNSYKIKNEIEPVSNFIVKILITEMARQRIYSESSIYKWKIDANDIEELAKSMERDNPTRHQVEMMLDDIASIDFDVWRGK